MLPCSKWVFFGESRSSTSASTQHLEVCTRYTVVRPQAINNVTAQNFIFVFTKSIGWVRTTGIKARVDSHRSHGTETPGKGVVLRMSRRVLRISTNIVTHSTIFQGQKSSHFIRVHWWALLVRCVASRGPEVETRRWRPSLTGGSEETRHPGLAGRSQYCKGSHVVKCIHSWFLYWSSELSTQVKTRVYGLQVLAFFEERQ